MTVMEVSPPGGPVSRLFGSLSTVFIVVGYSVASSLLTIVNKWAVTVFPFPVTVTMLQYFTCAAFVWSLGTLGVLAPDRLSLKILKQFFPAAVVFYAAIYTNTQLLLHANVETFIVFRSSTPLLVAVIDTIVRKQAWPSKTSFAAMFVILFGAIGYVLTDSAFTVTAYTWAFAYLCVITFDMVYIKHIVSSVGLNTWGLVYYNNLTSLLLSPFAMLASGELVRLRSTYSTFTQPWSIVGPVALSCAFGLAISFFGFACRKALTATSFTVLGVTNKLLTILVNVMVWDKHASNMGISSLLVCIGGGIWYQQSVTPPSKKPNLKAIHDSSKLPVVTDKILSPTNTPRIRVASTPKHAMHTAATNKQNMS